jgi:beta-N-acetylhexosaminidase
MISSKLRFYLFFLLAPSLVGLKASAQDQSFIQSLNQKNQWVDSVFNKMNRRKKVAQLFFVRALTNKGQGYEDSVAKIIKKEQVGGLVFFQGGPVRQADLENRYQALVKVPLLIAMDGEWGLGMRLDSTTSFPFQMTLGAISDNNLIYQMGGEVASDFKRMGMQMNLAPDMDINNNPDNPVINYRSFGDNKYNVAEKGIAYMKGMQDAGLLTTAKHFPGHGDTNVDSHLDLPLLPFSTQRLDSLEEYPFRQAINAGISGVMIAHMDIPALDTTAHLPSTLSRKIVTGILKDSLGFKGLVISDAMEMKAVVKYFPNGDADVRAFLAGNDMIELSENSKRAIKLIRRAVRKDEITKEEFEARVKKVLEAKYWAGLNHYQAVITQNLVADLNRQAEKELIQRLSDAAVTLLKGDTSSLKMNPLSKTAIVSIGVNTPTVFQQELAKHYNNNSLFNVAKDSPENELDSLLKVLKGYDQVFISINDMRPRPASKLNYSGPVFSFINELCSRNNTVTCVFANAYTIGNTAGPDKSGALLACYQMTDELQRSAVKVITLQLKPLGHLSVTISPQFETGLGLSTQ